MVRRAAIAAVLFVLSAAPGWASCRLALVMALDVSGSVDEAEYDLQMKGLASALGQPDVRSAIFAFPDAPVAMAVFEWASSSYQRLIVDWRLIEDDAQLDVLRATLAGWEREPAPEATGLGAAIEYAQDLMQRAPECWDQTLDVSGDGKNNDWPTLERMRAEGRLGPLRINGLVVATEFLRGEDRVADWGAAELTAYYRRWVINGPDAFIEVALGYEDYADAMRRKLLRELSTLPLGGAPFPLDGVRRASVVNKCSESGRPRTAPSERVTC